MTPRPVTLSIACDVARSALLAGLAAAIATSATAEPAAPADALPPPEVGIWYDDTGKGAVQIEPCGDRLCGRIAWLKDQLNAEGKPLVDRHNPDPKRRATPICGLQVIGQLAPMRDGSWDSGWIYDPKTGSAYDAALRLIAGDQLKVTGYKGLKILSKSFIWRRAPNDLPPCDTATEASAGAPGLPWAKK